MLSRILTLSIFLSLPALAADDCTPTVVDQSLLSSLAGVSQKLNQECPRQINPAQLCSAVRLQTSEVRPGLESNRFLYRTHIYQAACVESTDSPEVKQAKIQHFWNRYHASLSCLDISFSIENGHLLKLAVERNANEFVDDAVRRWKVNLNHIDPADQKTVLDFIAENLEKYRGTSLGDIYQKYFNLFKKNGAKFKREL